MRILYSFLLLVLLTFSVNAQNAEINKYIWDAYKRAGVRAEGTGAASFIKTDALKKTEEVMYAPSVITAYEKGSGGDIVMRDAFTYNEMGKETVALLKADSGSGFVNVQLDSVFYNEAGDYSVQRSYVWNNSVWMHALTVSYEYNEAGQVSVYTTEALDDGGWSAVAISYAYTPAGLIEQAVIATVVDGETYPVQRYAYTYNANNDVTEALVELPMGENMWMNFSRQVYEYDGSGFLISDQSSEWYQSAWRPASRTEYTNDGSGNPVVEVSSYRIDDMLVKSDSAVYAYGDEGKLSHAQYFIMKMNNWENYTKVDYTYSGDNYGSVTRYMWNAGEWQNLSRYTYDYNAAGSLLSLVNETGSVDGHSWVNNTKEAYEYDEHNNTIKGEYFEWEEGAWASANGSVDMGYAYYDGYLATAEYIPVDGGVAVEDDNINPNVFSLAQNYPNPFNPETKISFTLPQSGKASLKIYDMLGREVMELVNGSMSAGQHEVTFSGRDLSSGVYIYRLESGSFTESKKMALIK